ncbi:MAG: hypothetical protein ACE5E5_16045, partial [Phycisphaerae bacterium]
KRKQLRHVTADHISDWLRSHATWASTTKSDAVSHLSRAFRWGIKKKMIKHSPVADMEDCFASVGNGQSWTLS